MEDEWAGMWHDIMSFGWHASADVLLVGVVITALQLLLANELESDNAITVYVNGLGGWVRGLSWQCVAFGIVIPFALPKVVEMFLTQQTTAGFFVRMLASTIVGAFGVYAAYMNLKAFYISAEEESRYSPIEISKDEIETLAKDYFEKHPKNYSFKQFLDSLQETSPLGYKIPLTYETKTLARLAFQRTVMKKLGLVKSESKGVGSATTTVI
jgi:hypothetical protein